MLKGILIAGFAATLLSSCDVRKKDKLSTEFTKKDSAVTQQSSALPTTVQLIDSVYNFGKVTEGEMVEFSYRFKNTGSNPLIIENATASCGCTVPEKPEQPILPGETGYIKIKFTSEGRVGTAHKTINVTSNAQPGFKELLLTGEVLAKNKE